MVEAEYGQENDEEKWYGWRDDVDQWSNAVDNKIFSMDGKIEMHAQEIHDLRARTSESTWRSWFAETISSSMQVRDFVGDAVVNSLTGYGDGLKQILDEGKAYMKKISEETKDDVFSLIRFEVGR